LTKCVRDVALVMNAISGFDPLDPTSLEEPAPDFGVSLDKRLAGARLGFDRTHFLSLVDPCVRTAFEKALVVLESLGAHIIPVVVPNLEGAMAAASTILTVDASSYHQKWLREHSEAYQEDTRMRLQLGELIFATDYIRAMQMRNQFQREVRSVFETHRLSALISPTHPQPAQKLKLSPIPAEKQEKDDTPLKWNWHCMPFNVTGQPALSVPCGFSNDGLPIGLQIVGRPLDDETVLQIGNAYEGATEWHQKSPRL
jgi:aspartyl-tRNA(Asn)/glutamyl-tRNA(Gln) amidotransferase subunit A